jgi:outer membrane biosynthesis protein TonB
MRKSLISSFALHGAILIAALFILPNPDQFKVPPQEAVQVDISNIGDVTKKVATSIKAAPPAPKVAAPKVEPVKKVEPAPKVEEKVKTAAKEPTPTPPPPEPKKEEPKKEPVPPKEEPKPLDPDPLKDLLKKVEDPPPKKEEVKQAEVTPPKKPDVKKPVKKKPTLNTDDIAAFLNKTDDTKAAPQQPTEVAGSPKVGEKELQGSDDAASATLADALRQKLANCWSVPPGAREANITVKLHFLLAPDGSVTGQPEVLNGTADPLFSITAQSAVSAIMECQSYNDIFPADKYDLWKDNTINFNPNMMLGL